MCCFRTLKLNRMSCRCFSDCGNDGWRIATMKGSYKARFQKSRSTTFVKRKVFNTRFDVLFQGDESHPPHPPGFQVFVNLLSLSTLRKWPLDVVIFNRLSRILIL